MAIPANGSPVLENVTVAVHDNVATVPLRTPTFTTGFGFGDGFVLRVTWLDAHGKVIKHTTPLSRSPISGRSRPTRPDGGQLEIK
ncbi:MAG: hypothetical protein JO325_02460 [Solirubrobacterales bacterium]|nr:hypothetical protein [Solirubrobacterales bacterium]